MRIIPIVQWTFIYFSQNISFQLFISAFQAVKVISWLKSVLKLPCLTGSNTQCRLWLPLFQQMTVIQLVQVWEPRTFWGPQAFRHSNSIWIPFGSQYIIGTRHWHLETFSVSHWWHCKCDLLHQMLLHMQEPLKVQTNSGQYVVVASVLA